MCEDNTMDINDILENLCLYDARNPDSNALYKKTSDCICYCDNCFYGRDKLARYILELLKSEEKVCKNCKWWDKRYHSSGYCDYIETTHCHNMSTEVYVHDDSGLDVFLSTTGDFGCVNFKAREKA